jgi:hypothetical protein
VLTIGVYTRAAAQSKPAAHPVLTIEQVNRSETGWAAMA